MSSARHIRIFLSSPGDVSTERALAREAFDQLQYDPLLRGKITVEIVAWDKPGAGTPMLATLTPQEAINLGLPKPSECDIVVVIFWSKIGTLLPEEYIKPTDFRFPTGAATLADDRYLSGTEWEYVDAMQASRANGLPHVIVYRRTEEPVFKPSDPEFLQRYEQWQLVQKFFATFKNPDGSIRQGYNAYDAPDAFREQLEVHLRSLVQRLLDAPATPTTKRVDVVDLPGWIGSPFPGLRAFTPDDAPVFFGRGRETDALIKRVSEGRFVAVVGASGSGKSSLVGAGLIPRLLDNAIPGSKDWLWLRFSPGEVSDNPFSALAVQLAPLTGQPARELADQLAADPGALRTTVERTLNDQPEWAELLLFVDQFEELFTVVSLEYRAPFVDLLACAATTAQLRTVLTLRADFYHRCVEYPRLAELLRAGSFPLAAPELDALLDMIERPAVIAGLAFDQGLPGRILRDTGQEPGALALMAYALDELYTLAKTRGDHGLTFDDYEALGGVEKAIGTRAESVFAKLYKAAQDTLPHVFRELVEVDERGTATRQRAPLARFEGHAAAWTLLEKFTDARLLTTSGNDRDAVVEVAHEALFRSWPRLAEWVETAQDDLRLLRQVRLAVELWERNKCHNDFLWTGQRLKEAQAMVKRLNPRLGNAEREFLRSEVERLEERLKNPTLDHAARAQIGERLHIIGDTRPGVGLRPDGLPDIAWYFVPGGTVTLKGDDGKSLGVFSVEPFHIARHILTQIQFQAFLNDAEGFEQEKSWEGLAWDWQLQHFPRQILSYSNHPCTQVNWFQAIAFCQWLTARLPDTCWPKGTTTTNHEIRLPTEWEWQLAATAGNPKNLYPWGPRWETSRANTREARLGRAIASGMYPEGTPQGQEIYDMSGNTFEWCLNENEVPMRLQLSSDSQRTIRGGSWGFGAREARCDFRDWQLPELNRIDIGFRVVCAHTIP